MDDKTEALLWVLGISAILIPIGLVPISALVILPVGAFIIAVVVNRYYITNKSTKQPLNMQNFAAPTQPVEPDTCIDILPLQTCM